MPFGGEKITWLMVCLWAFPIAFKIMNRWVRLQKICIAKEPSDEPYGESDYRCPTVNWIDTNQTQFDFEARLYVSCVIQLSKGLWANANYTWLFSSLWLYSRSNINVAGLLKTGCIQTMDDFIVAIFITNVTVMIPVISHTMVTLYDF